MILMPHSERLYLCLAGALITGLCSLASLWLGISLDRWFRHRPISAPTPESIADDLLSDIRRVMQEDGTDVPGATACEVEYTSLRTLLVMAGYRAQGRRIPQELRQPKQETKS